MTHSIGVLLPAPNNEHFLTAMKQRLRLANWIEGSTVKFEVRTAAAGDVGQMEQFGRELIGLKPDLLVTASTPAVQALARATRSIPIVFVNIFDPVSLGLVADLKQPGGNLTGVMGFQIDVAGQWLATLKEMVPGITCCGLFFNPATAVEMLPAHRRALKTAAESRVVELIEVQVNDATEIDGRVGSVARLANSGLIVVPTTFAFTHRDVIIAAISKHRIPAIYGISEMIKRGGLLSYGPDILEQWCAAASHVDRILRGERPSNLAVQLAPKTALTINLKTAEAFGLPVPAQMRARADLIQ